MEVKPMASLKYQTPALPTGGLPLSSAKRWGAAGRWLRAGAVPITILALLVGLALTGPVAAQGEVRLSMSKAWGYSLGGQVQGLMNLSVSGPQDTASVHFEMDGNELAAATQPPFSIQFSTDKYPAGQHKLSATVRTAGGQTLQSNVLGVEFVSAEQGWQSTQRIIIPILGLVVAVMLISFGSQFLQRGPSQRVEPGAPRHYGAAGGAICPKCGRPFVRHLFGLNLLTGKLEKCPYCGKWSVVSAASPAALAAAEAAEREANQPTVPEASPEEKLLKQIEESRYRTD
jgi:hypothetical protein